MLFLPDGMDRYTMRIDVWDAERKVIEAAKALYVARRPTEIGEAEDNLSRATAELLAAEGE